MNICKILYVNKGVEYINLPCILNNTHLPQYLPSTSIKFLLPLITYELIPSIAIKIFNFNPILGGGKITVLLVFRGGGKITSPILTDVLVVQLSSNLVRISNCQSVLNFWKKIKIFHFLMTSSLFFGKKYLEPFFLFLFFFLEMIFKHKTICRLYLVQ